MNAAINTEKFLSALDDCTELLEAASVTREMVTQMVGNPVSASEFCAALNSAIVCNVISEQVKSFRDPAYWEEEHHGE